MGLDEKIKKMELEKTILEKMRDLTRNYPNLLKSGDS